MGCGRGGSPPPPRGRPQPSGGRREGTGGLTPRPSSPPPPRSPPAPPRPGAKVCPRWLVLGRECASVCPEGARPRQATHACQGGVWVTWGPFLVTGPGGGPMPSLTEL